MASVQAMPLNHPGWHGIGMEVGIGPEKCELASTAAAEAAPLLSITCAGYQKKIQANLWPEQLCSVLAVQEMHLKTRNPQTLPTIKHRKSKARQKCKRKPRKTSKTPETNGNPTQVRK